MSALADRVKIARSYIGRRCDKPESNKNLGLPPGPDINLSVQYLLNCGIANATDEYPHHLSCHGGNSLLAYQYIFEKLKFVPEDSCLAYIACSSESEEGWCPHARELTTCEDWNVCRNCNSFSSKNMASDKLTIISDEGNDSEEAKDAYGCKAVSHG